MHKRLQVMHPSKYGQDFTAGAVCHDDLLTLPLKWKKPCTVFVNSMSDLFHKDVPFSFIDKVFETMAKSPQHTFIILTKRADRMLEFFTMLDKHGLNRVFTTNDETWPLPNLWLGVSVEDQAAADERIPFLLQCPAAVRVLSVEPMLGPVDIITYTQEGKTDRINFLHGGKIHQVFCGGESGPDARPMHPNWARSLQQQCAASGVAFFFKQWGEYRPWKNGDPIEKFEHVHPRQGNLLSRVIKVGKHKAGRLLDGVEWNEFYNLNSSAMSKRKNQNKIQTEAVELYSSSNSKQRRNISKKAVKHSQTKERKK
jgi:protein gp37